MATQRFPSENRGEAGGGERAAGADYFRRVFGEDLDSLLDPASWSAGVDLANTYARMEYETRLAVEREREIADTVRAGVVSSHSGGRAGGAGVGGLPREAGSDRAGSQWAIAER